MLDQQRSFGRLVGSIPVSDHIDVGLDIGEHAAHHVSLPGGRFETDHRSRFESPGHGLVDGSIVVDINGRTG